MSRLQFKKDMLKKGKELLAQLEKGEQIYTSGSQININTGSGTLNASYNGNNGYGKVTLKRDEAKIQQVKDEIKQLEREIEQLEREER
jgi:hypothetical protein